MIGIALAVLLLAQEVNSTQSLNCLIEGNKRFAAGGALDPDQTGARRKETAERQNPFAIIVGCSDSRVPPVVVFDQGIGDLFTVRVAGNVVGPIEFDSIDYSAEYLHTPLILVLGHENCGAVKAVLQGQTKDIEEVAKLIAPAVKQAQKVAGDRLENAIKINVQMVVQRLKERPILKKLIAKGELDVHGGYYNFHTGLVEILE